MANMPFGHVRHVSAASYVKAFTTQLKSLHVYLLQGCFLQIEDVLRLPKVVL